MRFNSPEDLPSEYNVELLEDNLQDFNQARETLSNEEAKTLYWSLRLMMETYGGAIFKDKPLGYMNTAFGFFRTKNRGYDFGVIRYVDIRAYWTNRFRKLYEKLFLRKRTTIDTVEVDGNSFAVVTRHIKVTNHLLDSNPQDGTATCYVAPQDTRRYRAGILTAGHVVEYKRHSEVALSCGCTGKVVQLGHCMEAAVIKSPCVEQYIRPENEIFPQKHVVQKTRVVFEGINGYPVDTRIRQVTDTRGIYNASILPIIIYLEQAALPGDSGCLITDERSGNPLAIYVGKYSVAETGETGGLAQHLYQVSEIMKLKLYKQQ